MLSGTRPRLESLEVDGESTHSSGTPAGDQANRTKQTTKKKGNRAAVVAGVPLAAISTHPPWRSRATRSGQDTASTIGAASATLAKTRKTAKTAKTSDSKPRRTREGQGPSRAGARDSDIEKASRKKIGARKAEKEEKANGAFEPGWRGNSKVAIFNDASPPGKGEKSTRKLTDRSSGSSEQEAAQAESAKVKGAEGKGPTANKSVARDSWSHSSQEPATEYPQEDTRPTWQIQKEALKAKFGGEPWMPRKRLSPDSLNGIRALHDSDPETYSTPVLAQHFKITPEAIRRILKSKWRPNEEEIEDRKRRWEKRGELRRQGIREQDGRSRMAKRRRAQELEVWRGQQRGANAAFEDFASIENGNLAEKLM